MRTPMLVALAAVLTFPAALAARAAAEPIDLSRAVIVLDNDSSVPFKTAEMLHDEIQRRSGQDLAIVGVAPAGTARIVLGLADELKAPADAPVPAKAEGYSIWTAGSDVYLAGRDKRGALFAVGRLIRLLYCTPGVVQLASDTRVSTAPKYEYRVHQTGYRNTANSYDLWTVEQYEQYARDLAIFGTNGLELIQENGRDSRDSPLMVRSMWDMNILLSQMLDRYDFNVFVWFPLLEDISDQKVYDEQIEMFGEFFQEMPRIDQIFMPGGDPGNNPPRLLMPWSADMAKRLHKTFPKAELIISDQKFVEQDLADFYDYINDKKPKWLAGIAYGPGTHHDLDWSLDHLPKGYKVRHYPDITHNNRCQFGVPNWDTRHGQTLDREGINPRPTQMKAAHNHYAAMTNGFGSYSDGVHDDLNKVVWSALAWDPDADLDAILLDYGRVFFGEAVGADVAEGLRMLERNMEGMLIGNENVPKALAQWEMIGVKGGEAVRSNWRYQLYYFRAMFDVYIQSRLQYETELETRATAALAKAPEIGSDAAMTEASTILNEYVMNRVRPDLRVALEEGGLQALHSIGFQFSFLEPYRARNPERGALLDKVDVPMNNRAWLENEFAKVRELASEPEKAARIERLVNWENAGPGGFYDDLGNPSKQPHLVYQTTFATDPGFVHGPQNAHYRTLNNSTLLVDPTLRNSMLDQAETLYGTPLLVRYDQLDPNAEYKVRATYFGRYNATMSLKADDLDVHGAQASTQPAEPLEFDVPKAATQDGKLTLQWDLVEGRGCQVAEVWLIKK